MPWTRILLALAGLALAIWLVAPGGLLDGGEPEAPWSVPDEGEEPVPEGPRPARPAALPGRADPRPEVEPRLSPEAMERALGEFEGGRIAPPVRGAPLLGKDILRALPAGIPVEFENEKAERLFRTQRFVAWVPEDAGERVGGDIRRILEDAGWHMESRDGRLFLHHADPDREVEEGIW